MSNIPVAHEGAEDGSLVTRAGQLQFDRMLLGSGTSARWRDLAGWRDLPDLDVPDEPNPQAHGESPGRPLAGANVTTYTFLLRGTREAKLADLETLEAFTQPDGIERALVVDDGAGPSLRWARVIGRSIPQGRHFGHEPLECALQFRSADPRRYGLQEQVATARLAASSGGLAYPLTYPLEYGTTVGGAVSVTNDGRAAAPVRVRFNGPLTNPRITAPDWSLELGMNIPAGEYVEVDARAGTVLANGDVDRFNRVTATSSTVGSLVLQPLTPTTIALTAASGTGSADIVYRATNL